MIAIPRSLIRTCRAVFKRLARREPAVVTLETGPDGLRIRLHRTAIRCEYHQRGQCDTETLALPFAALADGEGKDGNVSFEAQDKQVLVRWQDRGIPQQATYPAEDASRLLSYPKRPQKMTSLPGSFLQALADASQTAAQDGTRFAMQNIQLRPNGQIAATDGRQLLLQSGFPLLLTTALMIPASPIFACKELQAEQVELGQTDSHLILISGPWTLYLPIDKDGRFPHIEEVIPRADKIATRCRFSAGDAAFLKQGLLRLPGSDEDGAPVTLDLNGQVLIRGKAEGQGRPTELVLTGSTVDGAPVRAKTDRAYLARALQLGFTGLNLVNADTPILCQDERRQYVWMLLGKQGAIPPAKDALQIRSAESSSPPQPQPETPPRRNPLKQSTNAKEPLPAAQEEEAPANGFNTLAEAEALKTDLRNAYTRISRLTAAIRKDRKQQRLLRSTLLSLRQLQEVGA